MINRIFLFGIIIGIGLPIVVIGSLYTIQINPKYVSGFPFLTSSLDQPQPPSYRVLNSSDFCSPEGSEGVYIGAYGSKSTLPCLEQINLKLDKSIILEEQEKLK